MSIKVQFRILREPTFYFLLLAAGISSAYWALNAGAAKTLQIDQREIDARILVMEMTQGYPASEEQRQEMGQALIDDYILVLEAYDLGLQNDARINDILAQKMRHVISGNVIQPSEAELESFYSSNLMRYASPARVTSDELVFNTPEALPEPILQQLAAGLTPDAIESEINRTQGVLPQVSQADLSSIFSVEFADRVFRGQSNTWVGPFLSNRGQHWLRVRERFPAATAPLNEIAEQVRLDWIAVEEEARLAEEVANLRKEYSVQIID